LIVFVECGDRPFSVSLANLHIGLPIKQNPPSRTPKHADPAKPNIKTATVPVAMGALHGVKRVPVP